VVPGKNHADRYVDRTPVRTIIGAWLAPAITHAETLLAEGYAALRIAGGNGPSDTDLLDVARGSHRPVRAGERALVAVVAELGRCGVFAALGQRTVNGLAELLSIEITHARRLVLVADAVAPRVDLQGQQLPPRLPATAAAFTDGRASLAHVQVIAALMASAAAARLSPDTHTKAEIQLAAQTGMYTPAQLRSWGQQLLELLDQDGAAPDDVEPEPVNDLRLTPHPGRPGGTMTARFDDPALYALIAAVIDAKAAPLGADDTRPVGQRQADALADVFGYVADHGDTVVLPETAGRRPHVTVLIRWEDLQNRARAACLDFAGVATPAALRHLCCDAGVIPVVLDGAGQPLDVGRSSRTIPGPLRRAVIARDRGCAHPGCDRPVSWSEIHHIIPWEKQGETKLLNLVPCWCPASEIFTIYFVGLQDVLCRFGPDERFRVLIPVLDPFADVVLQGDDALVNPAADELVGE
jgi:hypothetical protein